MSREIKFRVWDYKTMNYDPQVSDGSDGGETSRVYLNDAIDNSDDVIMQYTGIKDKNGVEIYEGDIVVAQTVERSPISPDYVSGYWKGVIVYYDNSFCLLDDGAYNPYWTNAAELEVIGNIHENKDLL